MHIIVWKGGSKEQHHPLIDMQHENNLKSNNQLLQFLECNGMSFAKMNSSFHWFRPMYQGLSLNPNKTNLLNGSEFLTSTGPAYTLVNPIQHVQLVLFISN